MRYKGDVCVGDMVHIYHMFGNSEYRDSEGHVESIDGDYLYGTWGEAELCFTDDWEIVEK